MNKYQNRGYQTIDTVITKNKVKCWPVALFFTLFMTRKLITLIYYYYLYCVLDGHAVIGQEL